jgi:hypothetical protein
MVRGSKEKGRIPMRNARTVIQSLTLFVLIFCGNSPVHGKEFIKAVGQTYYLDLDTKESEFSVWRLDDLGALTALHASIKIPAIRKDPKWAPDFFILLCSGDQSAYRDVGVRLITWQGASPLTIEVVQNLADGSLVTQYRVGKTLELNEKIDIEMDWSTPGTVTIKIGASSYSLKIPSQIEHVQISSSTGELIIDPLVIGSFKHKNSLTPHTLLKSIFHGFKR